MAATTLPDLPHDWNYSRKVTPRVLRTDFGGGYSQRLQDGINNLPVAVELAWTNLPEADRDTLIAFFEARAGVEAFNYQLPSEASSRQWSCTVWADVNVDYGYFNVTASFQEEFDL